MCVSFHPQSSYGSGGSVRSTFNQEPWLDSLYALATPQYLLKMETPSSTHSGMKTKSQTLQTVSSKEQEKARWRWTHKHKYLQEYIWFSARFENKPETADVKRHEDRSHFRPCVMCSWQTIRHHQSTELIPNSSYAEVWAMVGISRMMQ